MAKLEPRRCHWCINDPLYIIYHDQEWGVQAHEDRYLFEMLILESFQAGLSWITVLRKREHFRQAFAHFDPLKVSRFSASKIAKLMQNANLIRHQAKMESAINNAKCFLRLQKEYGSFDRYLWQFSNYKTLRYPRSKTPRTTSPEALALAKDLKKQGFKFMGPTTCYAYMQAVGMVDDHAVSCYRYK